MAARILAIHAHPDDLEILACGTLALLARRGHRLSMVTMTPGDKGTDVYSPEEISAIRLAEAASAARLIGAEYYCADFRDFAIFGDDLSRKRIVEVLRKFQPELVLTAAPVDYLSDHEVTSDLVRDACFGAPMPNYHTIDENPAPVLPRIPHLYFVDPVGGVDRDNRIMFADFYVNIESTFETKRAMLAEHRSQREWLLRHHGMDDYMISMENWTRERGRLAGVTYAEGFRLYKGHPYPQSPRLEELLGPDVVIRA